MHKAGVLLLAGGLFALGACDLDQLLPRYEQTSREEVGTVSREVVSVEGHRRCGGEIPFEPTYLPAGFDHQLIPGRAPGGRPPDGNQVISHFRGDEGRAIEVRRPGTLFVELALGDDAPTISILGADTADFGPITPGSDEFMAFIPYPNSMDPDDRCHSYSLNEVGVPLSDLKKVAEGLRETK